MEKEKSSREHDGTREVKNEHLHLVSSSDAPNVGIHQKPKPMVISPPPAGFGVQ